MSPKKPLSERLRDAAAAASKPNAGVFAGGKDDGNKLRFSLFPIETLKPILAVLEFGAKKYAEESWRTVEGGKRRYADALHRHYVAYLCGEKTSSDGLSTIACVVVNGLFLLAFEVRETTS